MLLRDHQRSDS